MYQSSNDCSTNSYLNIRTCSTPQRNGTFKIGRSEPHYKNHSNTCRRASQLKEKKMMPYAQFPWGSTCTPCRTERTEPCSACLLCIKTTLKVQIDMYQKKKKIPHELHELSKYKKNSAKVSYVRFMILRIRSTSAKQQIAIKTPRPPNRCK